MIAKGKSISHGTAALEYDLAKEINGEAAATEIHRHELFGCTGEEMVQEMKPYFVDFPNVRNNCLRFEVSPSVEESAGMTDADWAKLGNDFMQRMGLMNHQYIIVKHSGTEKNSRQAHLHILANRVSLSGELYKDNWIGKRATEAANSIATHFFSFFPAILTTEHGELSRVRAEKTAQRSCSGFFQIRTCEALDSFGVWSYLCRPKKKKSLIQQRIFFFSHTR
jgi:hypothetical protein